MHGAEGKNKGLAFLRNVMDRKTGFLICSGF